MTNSLFAISLKRFLIVWAFACAILACWRYMETNLLLQDISNSLGNLVRNRTENTPWLFTLLPIISSFFFTSIYSQWKSTGSVIEGALFGFFTGVWINLAVTINTYATS